MFPEWIRDVTVYCRVLCFNYLGGKRRKPSCRCCSMLISCVVFYAFQHFFSYIAAVCKHLSMLAWSSSLPGWTIAETVMREFDPVVMTVGHQSSDRNWPSQESKQRPPSCSQALYATLSGRLVLGVCCLAELGIEAETSCSKVLSATHWLSYRVEAVGCKTK